MKIKTHIRILSYAAFSVLWCMVLLANKLPAQPSISPGKLIHYYLDKGMDASQITTICQDDFGFIWLGTDMGLYRFNGYEFQPFDEIAELNSAAILALQKWGDEALMISTAGALYQFLPATTTLKSWSWNTIAGLENLDSLLDVTVIDEQLFVLFKSAKDEVFLAECSPGSRAREVIPLSAELHSATQLLADQNRLLICGNGLVVYDLKSKKIAKVSSSPSIDMTLFTDCSIARPNDKAVLISTFENGIYQLDNEGQLSQLVDSVGQLYDMVVKDSQSVYLLTGRDGLLTFDLHTKVIDPGKFEPSTFTRFYNFDLPTALFVDKDQHLWYITSNGLTLFSKTEKEHFEWIPLQTSDEERLRFTQPILLQDSDKLYAPYIGGIRMYDIKNRRIIGDVDTKSIGIDPAFYYAYALGNAIYLYAKEGLFKLDSNTDELHFVVDPAKYLAGKTTVPYLNGIFIGSDSIIWLPTKDNYLLEHNLHTSQTYIHSINNKSLQDRAGYDLIYQVIEADDGSPIIQSYSGIYFFDKEDRKIKNVQEKYRHLVFPEIINLYGLLNLSAGKIIFCAVENGLYIYDTSRDSIYQPPNQTLQELSIIDVFADKNNNIWGTSPKGLLLYNPDKNALQLFDRRDGLYRDKLDYHYLQQATDGYMYMGCINGIERFDPDAFLKLEQNGGVLIQSINVNNKSWGANFEVWNDEKLSLSYSQRNLAIRFGALDYGNEATQDYTFILENWDTDWRISNENRTATYYNLAPGSYTFKVRNLNGDDVDVAKMEIKIHPPFWLNPWYYLLAMLLFSALIYLIYHYRVKQIRQQAEQTTALNKQIAELEMKALRSQMNPHFLFNCLNSIKSYITQHKEAEALDYLNKFSQLIRLILENSKSEKVRLQQELLALQLYIELERARSAQQFDYEINVGEQVNADFVEIPPLILQPYVENAIWHGLMHKQDGKGVLKIDIRREGDLVQFVIEDNGIGRTASKKLKGSSSASKHRSLGMQITRDRLGSNGHSAEELGYLKIDDLKNGEGQASGTRITIRLPIPE